MLLVIVSIGDVVAQHGPCVPLDIAEFLQNIGALIFGVFFEVVDAPPDSTVKRCFFGF